MTIHRDHPFADPDPDPARRLRGRVGATVSLWTAGDERGRAGLTVSSWLVAHGDPARVVGLLDPDSDLADVVARTGRLVVALLAWRDRDLAEAFAGQAPAPGGVFALAPFDDTAWGPRLARAGTWAGVAVESTAAVGWSLQLTGVLEQVVIGADPAGPDDEPLVHRRGRYLRPGSTGPRRDLAGS